MFPPCSELYRLVSLQASRSFAVVQQCSTAPHKMQATEVSYLPRASWSTHPCLPSLRPCLFSIFPCQPGAIGFSFVLFFSLAFRFVLCLCTLYMLRTYTYFCAQVFAGCVWVRFDVGSVGRTWSGAANQITPSFVRATASLLTLVRGWWPTVLICASPMMYGPRRKSKSTWHNDVRP